MTHILRKTLLALWFVSATIGTTAGQALSPEEAEIKQVRSDISALTKRPPQTEASRGDYTKTLLDLRVRLAALLNQQIGALKRDIRELSANSASAPLQKYIKGREQELAAIEDEIKSLAMTLTTAPAPANPSDVSSTATSQPRAPTANDKRDPIPTKPALAACADRPLRPLPKDAQGRKYGEPGFVGEPMNIDVVNAPLRDVMEYLCEQYGVNYFIDPSISSQLLVTAKADSVPWNNVIDSILNSLGAGTAVTGDALRIASKATLAKEAEVAKGLEDARKKEEERKANFDAQVQSFTSEKLAAATAPATLMSDKSASSVDCARVVADSDPDRFYSKYDQAVCFLADSIKHRVEDDRQRSAVRLGEDKGNLLTILIAKLLKTNGSASLVSFVTEAQEARTDQQVGAGPSSSGTTSLVSKGGIPYLLGFAVENGAATESTSGTTATFRISPGGLIQTLAKKGFITGYREADNDLPMKFLRKSSIGLTFDTSRGNNPGTFVGDRQQLSQFSVRYEFVNDRDPRNKKYEADWERLVGTVGREFARTTWATTSALQTFGSKGELTETLKDPALQAWLSATNEKLANATTDYSTLVAIIRSQLDLIPVEAVSAETVDAVTRFAEGFQAYETGRKQLLDKIAKGKLLTFEYTNTRGVNAPDLSNFNFIAATGTGARVDLTANGSFTFFNKLPLATPAVPKPGRIRDFQFAGQVTIPFKLGDAGQFDFWFSGRYERLLENASTPAGTTMPNTKGDIAVGQFGLNIPIKSLGIKFPVSVTFANRTELIKEKEVRGNIGFTFNWDTLFSKLKPF
jgi:hypothetical protein